MIRATGYEDIPATQQPPRKKKRGCGCVLPIIVILIIAILGVHYSDRVAMFIDDAQIAIANMMGSDEKSAREVVEQQAPTGGPAYAQLSEEGQNTYLVMLAALQDRSKVAVDVDIDGASFIFEFIRADHPELFYVENIQITTMHSLLGTRYEFEGIYNRDADEQAAIQEQIDAYVDACMAGMPQVPDDYAIAKYLYDYLVTHTSYEANAPDNQNIVSVFVNGRSVCNGYAKAYQYLLQHVGIESMLVTGEARGSLHAWDVVKLDGEYYHIDPTWGDPQFISGGEGHVWDSYVNYDYLGASDADIKVTHRIGGGNVKAPTCTATKDNYYVHEGLYITSGDEATVRKAVRYAVSRGDGFVRLRCADEATYDAAYYMLITQGYASVWTDRQRLQYTTDSDLHTIVLALG